MTSLQVRRAINRNVLDNGIIVPESDDGFGGRVVVTKDGQAWAFSKKLHYFIPIRLKAELIESKGKPSDN